MDQAATQARFQTLPEWKKILFLVDLMHEFTIIFRGVITDGDNEKSLKARIRYLSSITC
jgi:hypothetical protein